MKRALNSISVLLMVCVMHARPADSCANDPSFKFNVGAWKERSCPWLTTEAKKSMFCNKMDTSGTSLVKDGCPVACGNCPSADQSGNTDATGMGLVKKNQQQTSEVDNIFVQTTPHQNAQECTLVVQNLLRFYSDEEIFACILNPIDANGDDNCILPLILTLNQKNILKDKFDTGQLVSAISTLQFGEDFEVSSDEIRIPSNIENFSFGSRNSNNGRNQQFFGKKKIEGDKNVLVVKVRDSQNRAVPDTTDQISDNVFGTSGDPLNLKSQMNACSFDKVDMVPGEAGIHTKSPGVIEVQINMSLVGNGRFTIMNAVTLAVQQLLEQALPAQYDNVMYVLENCYGADCNWGAYANRNSWLSVYQKHHYKQVAVQLHGKF